MKSIEELLKNLARPEVLEFGLVTNRLPSVNIGGKFEPVDDEAPNTDALLEMLVKMGGSRHVESLSEKPVQWTTRLDGVGVIAVAAIMRKDVVQARFTVARRDAPAREPAVSPTAKTQVGPPQPTAPDKAAAAVVAQANRAVPAAFARTRQGPAPAPAAQAPPAAPSSRPSKKGGTLVQQPAPPAGAPPQSTTQAAQPQPQPARSAAASRAQVAAKPAAPPKEPPPKDPLEGAVPPPDEFDDDDEPTVQTLSPPVQPPPASQKEEARPKPARKPSDVDGEAGGSQDVAAAAPPAREGARAAEPEPRRAPAEERPKEAPAEAQPRRINTPTSVDAVEVEVSTSETDIDLGSLEDEDEAGTENTVELRPPQASPAPGEVVAKPSAATPAASPAQPPKDAPRAEGSFEALLALAVSAGATDMHLLPERPALLRVATDLLPRTQPIAADVLERFARGIVPARLRETLEKAGACAFTIEHGQHGRFRVHASRQRTGIKLTLRVLPREVPTLAALGLPEVIGGATRYEQGLVLVTGPAGHGKSTTLAALVDSVNEAGCSHVVSIEDPIELVHARKRAIVSQREIGLHAKSLPAAIEAALREDPDVLVVEELRDADSVRLAVHASENGVLVLATMASPSVAKTLDRILDLFPVGEQVRLRTSLAGALRMIVGQRLVPSADRKRVHAAAEVLPSSIPLYSLVRDGRTFQIPALMQQGKARGVVRLEESLASLVRAQKVTLEAAKQHAESTKDLESLAGAAPAARKG